MPLSYKVFVGVVGIVETFGTHFGGERLYVELYVAFYADLDMDYMLVVWSCMLPYMLIVCGLYSGVYVGCVELYVALYVGCVELYADLNGDNVGVICGGYMRT
jgi:hypothetical protein